MDELQDWEVSEGGSGVKEEEEGERERGMDKGRERERERRRATCSACSALFLGCLLILC